jgi:hypothetical protein
MEIGNFSVPNNPNRLPRLIEHARKIYDTYHGDAITNAKKNDALAQLLGFKSSNNGAYWSELAALKAYELLDGRSDLRITDLGKQVTYGTENQKPPAILKAFLTIPLWKQLYERYRLQLPSQEFWAKLQHITGCEAPVAKSNEQFITEAFREDASLIKSVKEYLHEGTDLTRPDQDEIGNKPQDQSIQFIEVKAGPFYQRLPYTEQGKAIAVNFLNALEIEAKKPKKDT